MGRLNEVIPETTKAIIAKTRTPVAMPGPDPNHVPPAFAIIHTADAAASPSATTAYRALSIMAVNPKMLSARKSP